MDDGQNLRDRINGLLLSVTAWGGTAALATVMPSDWSTLDKAIVAAGLGGVAAALDRVPDLHRAVAHRNWFRVLFGFAKKSESEADVSKELNAAMLHDNARAVLFDVLKRLTDAVDPNVLPSLGKLLREYAETNKPVDAFFRGASRVLLDITGAEKASLRIMLVAIRDSKNVGPFVDMSIEVEPKDFDFTSQRLRIPLRPQTGDDYEFEHVDGTQDHARRLIHLLVTHALGVDPGTWGSAPGFAMHKDTAARLIALLDV